MYDKLDFDGARKESLEGSECAECCILLRDLD